MKSKPKKHPWRRWSDRDIFLITRYAGLKSAKEIGEMIGRSPQSVKSKAQELMVPLYQYGEKHHNAKHSDATVEYCRRLNENGMSQRKVAAHVNISVGMVRPWLEYRKRTNDKIVFP